MKKTNLLFARELEMPVYYDNIQIGTRRVDFFVENKVMVELKALTALDDVHIAQAINYLEAYKMEIGLFINFGARSLQFKRFTIENKLKGRVNSHQSPNQKNQRCRPQYYLTGSGASLNFLCLPESLPKKIVTGKITFFTKEGISGMSNSDLYFVSRYAPSNLPGSFPPFAFVDL